MKTSLRGLSLIASVAAAAVAAPALATIYRPMEDADLLRRADAVVVARAADSTVVASPGGLPETRTTFTVVDTLAGPASADVDVAVPGGDLPGLSLVVEGAPRFTPGGVYVLALKVRADGAYVPAELGLGAFEVVRDEAGRSYATRAMFRSERAAVLQREADGSLSERREPLRELAAFTSWVRAGLYREAPEPGEPPYVVARESGALSQVRHGGVSALWDDHWCPGGIPGTCGSNFTRYRWVDTTATVRACDESTTTTGQWGVIAGGFNELQNAVALWTNDPDSTINYTYAPPAGSSCNPGATPSPGTIPVYFDDLSMFGGSAYTCPMAAGGTVAITGIVTDNTTHAWKGSTYTTVRAGIAWVRRLDAYGCHSDSYGSNLFETVMANTLGASLGLTAADKTRNPNDLNPDDDRFALMLSTYTVDPWPALGSDDRAAVCFLYGDCLGLPQETTLFVPFVGRVSGQANSVFTSEMALTNRSQVDSTVLVEYTPSAGTGKGAVTTQVGAGKQMIIPDVIAWLRTKGLTIAETGDAAGTLRVTFGGVYTYNAAVTVRTTTAVPPGVTPSVGRAGLAYLGVPEVELHRAPVWLLGLRKSTADRSNIAFQNAGVEADGIVKLRATWYSSTGVIGATPVERTLSPGGWTQFELTTLEPAATEGYVKVELVEGRAPWYAYGVVNDAKNSDGSFIAPISDDVIKTRETLVLPVAVEAGPYQTEIILDNVADVAKTALLKWVADELPGDVVTVEYVLPAGRQLVIPDWVQVLRNAGVAIPPKGTRLTGAIFVKVPGGTISGLSISGRVLNPASDVPAMVGALEAKQTDWGRYGVHYPAATRTCLTTQTSWLAGLRQDELNRTNLAIVNTGEADGTSSTYLVEVFNGDTGLKAGETFVTNLPFEHFIQVDRALSQIAPGVTNAYIRVTAVNGANPFITYAVVNDGSFPGVRSGDGAYIPSEIVPIK